MKRPVPFGRTVVVYGPSGSGKSTLGAALARRLGLSWIELDPIYHARPNWDDLTINEFRTRVAEVLAVHPDGWVIDGNYGMVRDLILPRAKTVVWLELPFATVYRRLALRTLSRTFRGTELWNGNRETFKQNFTTRQSMLWWGATVWARTNRTIHSALRDDGHSARVYRLRTVGQVRYLLKNAVLDDASPPAHRLPSSAQKEEYDADLPRR